MYIWRLVHQTKNGQGWHANTRFMNAPYGKDWCVPSRREFSTDVPSMASSTSCLTTLIQELPGWNRIAAFDLESEVWMETINGPSMGWFEVEQKEWRIALMELKGTLCMVHNIQDPNYLGPYANIWRFIDYNKSVWVKAYMIRLPEECLYIKPLDVLDDGRILLLNMGCSRFILQFFNPSTKAFTDIMEMAEGFTGRMNFYTGSLLSF